MKLDDDLTHEFRPCQPVKDDMGGTELKRPRRALSRVFATVTLLQFFLFSSYTRLSLSSLLLLLRLSILYRYFLLRFRFFRS